MNNASNNSVNVLNEVRDRKRNTRELVGVAIAIGFILNLAASAFLDVIKEWPYINFSIGIMLLSFIILLIAVDLKGEISYSESFSVLVPFNLKNNTTVETISIKGYAPSEWVQRNYSSIVNQPETQANLVSEIQSLKGNRRVEQNGVIFEMIRGLILSIIKEYGEHSLTTASLYHSKYQRFSGKFMMNKIENGQLPKTLQSNRFFKASLKLPDKVKIAVSNTDSETVLPRVELQSRYASVLIETSPAWSLVTPKNSKRNYDIAIRKIMRGDSPVLISIPVQCRLSVKQTRIFGKNIELFYSWMSGLSDDLNLWLSWEKYREGDMERLLVDTFKKVDVLQKNMQKHDPIC